MNITVKIQDVPYTVEIEDLEARPVIACIGEELFEIWPQESPCPSPHLQKEAPSTRSTGRYTSPMNSPMIAPLPGIVTRVFIQPGEFVKSGDPLLVIEAMKMKNTIFSDRSGTIATILVQPGELVKHHQVLCEFSQ